MGVTLAVAGKGGVGKTSITSLMIKALVESGKKPLLAIDADSNSNLHEVLGLPKPRSVGCIREDTRKMGDDIPGGMTKDRFMEYQIQASLEEGKAFDFLSMGRPEGPGCYCMANNILREVIARLTSNYEYVVIDNEAGMEHLSRRTDQDVDHLFVISDPAPRSLRTIGRIVELVEELKGRIQHKHLVLSRVQGSDQDLPETTKKEIARLPYPPEALVPYDDSLVELDLQGEPLMKISTEAPAYRAVKKMLEDLKIL
ncbi:MAG: AAA family ATPase [Deltaproteobacteria bacterium]|nr:AAA family ATPase [Deltaproteobacteria bacterium]